MQLVADRALLHGDGYYRSCAVKSEDKNEEEKDRERNSE